MESRLFPTSLAFVLYIFFSVLFPTNILSYDLLLTPPKSGTHWFMYSLAFLTKRDAFGDGRFSKLVNLDYSKPIIKHAHGAPYDDYINRTDRLIVLIRDFKENFPRAYVRDYNNILRIIAPDANGIVQMPYYSVLRAFDSWNPNCRLLIYYEDLILKPKETFSLVLDYLEEKKDLLSIFLENIEYHKRQCINYYNSIPKFGKAITEGKNLEYHRNKTSKKDVKKMVSAVKRHWPDLSKKYLRKYL